MKNKGARRGTESPEKRRQPAVGGIHERGYIILKTSL